MPDSRDLHTILVESLKLVSYADLYDYAPTLDEVVDDLPCSDIEKNVLADMIVSSPDSYPVRLTSDNRLYLKGRDNLIELGKERRTFSKILLKNHEREIKRLTNLPYVRTVILSGALAFDNAGRNDDVDLFLIVQSNRLWLVDLYNLFIFRIWKEKICRCPRGICSNYIVEDVSMRLSERDFFTAHQIKHMRPLYDEGCWDDFTNANDWVQIYFPSYILSSIPTKSPIPIKRFFEIFGDLFGAGILNALIFAIRGKRLKRKKRLGYLKGSYEFRHLKANDSRRGEIAMMRLSERLRELVSGMDGKFEIPDPALIIADRISSSESQSKDYVSKFRYAYFKLFVEGRLSPSKIFNIDGIKIKVPAGVFHPAPFDSSLILLKSLRKKYKTLAGKRTLDMGTGSGIHAIAMAMLGAEVTAVDINPTALNAALNNALMNKVNSKIEFVESDLFEKLQDRKYDLVVFNPPFYEGEARDLSEVAWRDTNHETIVRFLSSLHEHLTDSGESLIILSDRMDLDFIENTCRQCGLSIEVFTKRKRWDEVYTVYTIRKL